MNKKKLSCILAITMVATQVSSVAFAYNNSTYNQNDIDVISNDLVNEKEKQSNVDNENNSVESNEQENDVDGGSPEELTTNKNVQSNTDEKVNNKVVGNIEVDINFALPIKNIGKDSTNISVKLLKDEVEVGIVQLGNDVTSGKVGEAEYILNRLDGKRLPVSDDDKEVRFYHLTFKNLDLGTYSIELLGEGYNNTLIENVVLQDSSKRIKIGTSDNKIVLSDNNTPDDLSDDKVDYYPGVFLAGDVNEDNAITIDDYNEVKESIKANRKSKKLVSTYDINKDAKVDITDLSYIHKNIDKDIKSAEIVDTDAIINPNKVDIALDETKVTIGEGQDIKNILVNDSSKVSIETKAEDGTEAPVISAENPISIPINLAGITMYTTNNSTSIETIVIKAPSATRPTSGTVVLAGETYSYNESNVRPNVERTVNGDAIDEIVIDLGKQVAVSEITINVTGSRGNKNLVEIAKVEFLNNVYKELPKPNMNIPVINNFTSSTSVGSEAMNISWNHEPNVTGYEVKVEEVNDKGEVLNRKGYRTSENKLEIKQIKPYSVYRFSIQSINGSEWTSGYKDDQEEYNSQAVGATNIDTNINDKDGKPDNVDGNYIPQGWNSISGILGLNAENSAEDSNKYGSDSIVELQVIPESKPEGPEGIVLKGESNQLKVSWKAHAKAKDYDLYYRKVGDGAWIKANDPNDPKYVDSDGTNNIPDGVTNIEYADKEDRDELIRTTNYNIGELEEGATYEIKMTATNHHGTGALSNTYLGTVKSLVPPKITEYNLINRAKGDVSPGESPVEGIVSIGYPNYHAPDHPNGVDEFAIVDNDYKTYWTSSTWNIGHGGGPMVTFDQEYKMDTIRLATRLESPYGGNAYDYVPVRYYDSSKGEFVNVNGKYAVKNSNGKTYYEIKLPQPITTNKISVAMRIHPAYSPLSSISEIKFYNYDSLESDVANLFADDLRITLNEDVTQSKINELATRAKTIDPGSMEYHPNQERILSDLDMAQNILDDTYLSKDVLTINPKILNNGPTLGQGNNWQSLGVAVKPGDEISIYVGTERGREHSKFEVLFTQSYAESGSWNSGTVIIGVGKNDIQVPQGSFSMDVEKGGNVYIRPASGFHENQPIQVRVSGANQIPHLNVNNIITDEARQVEAKELIRNYIRGLKDYVADLPNKYPEEEDKINNQYKYDEVTSVLNTTEIEGKRITLSLSASQVLKGIESGLNGNEDLEVERLYDALLAWEQIMEVSYSLKGVIENPIDFNNNGKIDNNKNDTASLVEGLTETEYFNKHRAPRNRINVKLQRMFTGAFMYASGHHVGIDYGSVSDMVKGVAFKFDDSGNITNPDEGKLYGWGIGHEIGHVQDQANLTQAEVTNNILALITQTFNGESKSRLEGSNIYKVMYNKVTSGSIGAVSNIFAKLGMYWQLNLAYENSKPYEMLENNKDTDITNDSFYAKLYRLNRIKQAAPNETGFDKVEQTFIMRASDAAGKDLRDFFKKWGIISSPNTNKYLDSMAYPKEDRAIYYLNDEAKRRRLDPSNSETMAEDTQVNATFGTDKNGNQINSGNYLNQKEVPLNLGVTKDSDKILGYELIRREATELGIKDSPVGFIEADRNSEDGITRYTDVINAINNRTLGYKVVAYDYDLNKTEEAFIGEIKVTHDGSIEKSSWILSTNTVNDEDIRDEDSGHGTVQNGVITRIKDNNDSTVFQGMKDGKKDPEVIIDLNNNKSLVGLTYTAPEVTTKKFSLKNIFKKSEEKVYKPISDYEVYTSEDGSNWEIASRGKFDTTKRKQTIYFSETGNPNEQQLWAYNARYVKIVAKKNTEISIAELDLLSSPGDNIEIGIDNNDQVYKNGVGRLKSDYEYAPGKVIPGGSIIVTGEYRGNPAFNVPLVLNENNENFALKSKAILLATLPEDSEVAEIAEGNWIYWIEPQDQGKVDVGSGDVDNLEGTKIKAELYRYNKLNEQGAPVGQRLVSDTFLIDLPNDLSTLPEMELNGGGAKAYSSESKAIIEIDNDLMIKVSENRK